MKPCVLVPIYDHGDTIGDVVASLAPFGLHCFVIDDGSGPATRRVLDALEKEHPFAEVFHRKENGGRGAALKTGYRLAARAGYSHAVQLDADGQHRAADLPAFLREIERHPDALVLGSPIFDGSAPRSRVYGRQLSRAMVWAATLSFDCDDPLCGYRAVPLAATVRLLDGVAMGDAMDFDPELVIRLHRRGVPVRNVPTPVVYAPGGISHFRMLHDNARMTWLYTRALLGLPLWLPRTLARRVGRRPVRS